MLRFDFIGTYGSLGSPLQYLYTISNSEYHYLKEVIMESVIVTGGTRGIGLAISLRLNSDGFVVHALYHDLARHAWAQALTERTGVRTAIRVHQCDVGDPEAVARFFDGLPQNEEVVALVNNAGTYGPDPEAIWRTNVLGPSHMTAAFATYRKQHPGYGAVVNIGSTSANHGPTGSAAYAASKAAMHREAGILATIHAKQLRVNTVVCGPVDTELLRQALIEQDTYVRETPSGRLTTPDEVAAVVSWMVRSRELNLVGTEITLDGGRSCDYRVRTP